MSCIVIICRTRFGSAPAAASEAASSVGAGIAAGGAAEAAAAPGTAAERPRAGDTPGGNADADGGVDEDR